LRRTSELIASLQLKEIIVGSLKTGNEKVIKHITKHLYLEYVSEEELENIFKEVRQVLDPVFFIQTKLRAFRTILGRKDMSELPLFRKEIINGFESEKPEITNYLIKKDYLNLFSNEDLHALLKQFKTTLNFELFTRIKLLILRQFIETKEPINEQIIKDEIASIFKLGNRRLLKFIIEERFLLYFSKSEINCLLVDLDIGYGYELLPHLKLATIVYDHPELFRIIKNKDASIDDLFSIHRTLSEKLRLEWLFEFSAQLWIAFLEQHPTIWKGWYLLGIDLLDKYKKSKGFQAFSECLDLVTEKTINITISDNDVIEHILDLSMDWGEKLLTIRTLFALIQIFPENIEYIFDLTQLLFIYNEYEKAEMILRRSLKKNKKNSNILYLLSFSLWYQKKYDFLIPILKRLLKIGIDSSIIRFLLMTAYREVGNLKKAKNTEELLNIKLYNESQLELDFKILKFALYKQKRSSSTNSSSYSFIWCSKLLARSFKYHKNPIYDEWFHIKPRV